MGVGWLLVSVLGLYRTQNTNNRVIDVWEETRSVLTTGEIGSIPSLTLISPSSRLDLAQRRPM